MMHAFAVLDLSVLSLLYSVRFAPLTAVMMAITSLGQYKFVFVILAAAVILLLLNKKAADAAGLLVAVLGSGVTTLLLKMLVERSRPEIWYQAYTEGPYWSFPSAHAALAVALYGYFLYILLQSHNTWMKRIMIYILAILIPLICFSRLYLGVHYLSDVLVGLTIGAVFVLLGRAVRIYLLE